VEAVKAGFMLYPNGQQKANRQSKAEPCNVDEGVVEVFADVPQSDEQVVVDHSDCSGVTFSLDIS
jgi:hypothetical protein